MNVIILAISYYMYIMSGCQHKIVFFSLREKKIATTINNWGWGIVFSEYINTNMYICTQGKIGFNCSISQIFMTLFIHKIEF